MNKSLISTEIKKKISIPGSLNNVTTSFNKWQLQNSKKSKERNDVTGKENGS